MASLLKEGGSIVVKTDNVSFYEFTLEQAEAAGLDVVYKTEDYLFDEENDAMSEYERNFRSQGVKIHRLILKKK